MSVSWDRWEAYFTPGPVAEQGLRLIPTLRANAPRRLLDLGAGAGVFGQRARLVWPGVERFGAEVRAHEERRAARHYEAFWPGDYFDLAAGHGGFDLVVSNPPFSRTRNTLALALSLLAPGGVALFFVRASWGQAMRDFPFVRRHPPTLAGELVGRVNLRRGTSSAGHELAGDNVGHKWLCLERGRRAAAWTTILLPPLPPDMRRWIHRPGTESRVDALPSEFWPGALDETHEPRTRTL